MVSNVKTNQIEYIFNVYYTSVNYILKKTDSRKIKFNVPLNSHFLCSSYFRGEQIESGQYILWKFLCQALGLVGYD